MGGHGPWTVRQTRPVEAIAYRGYGITIWVLTIRRPAYSGTNGGEKIKRTSVIRPSSRVLLRAHNYGVPTQ